ncbi:UNVERIFIED_ORG: putative membrane protein [Clostridioides difficile F501]
MPMSKKAYTGNPGELDSIVRRNAVGAYLVKGGSVVVGLISIPAYMSYFDAYESLGVWYTILSILSWVSLFDFGMANGLRNVLASSIALNDYDKSSRLVSSAYAFMSIICLVLMVACVLVVWIIPWTQVFNVESGSLSESSLAFAMMITGIGLISRMALQIANSVLYALQKSFVVNLLLLVSNTAILMFLLLCNAASDDGALILLSFVHIVCLNLPLLIMFFVFLRSSRYFSIRKSYCSWSSAKESLSIGVVVLYLQCVWMVVSALHPILITQFVSADAVVEYQVYYKIYFTIASLAGLALLPIWSAVTKAKSEKRIDWIVGIYKKSLWLAAVVLCVCVATAPFLQVVFDIWLGADSMTVNGFYVIAMSAFACVFALHNVNSSIQNGLNYFKLQIVCMTVGAVLLIPLAAWLSSALNSWIGVVIASTISLLPYQIAAPVFGFRYLKRLKADDRRSFDR